MTRQANRYALDPAMRALLADIGVSPAVVLRRAGLPLDLLNRANVWLEQHELFDLWHSIEVEVSEPNLPLAIGRAFSPEMFAAPVFAALTSPDLNTAASRLAVFKRLIGPVRLVVDIGGAQTRITYKWPQGAEPPASLVLTELLFWVELARSGTRRNVQPIDLMVPEPPEDHESYRAHLGVTVRKGAAQYVEFAAADACLPFLTANESLWKAFEPELRRRLSELDLDATWNERVRAVLLELLPSGRTTVAHVAAELAVSIRTLHRRLSEESTSFQRVLDSTREELARHYLSNRSMSATEISFLLGYGEPSSFYRAFHNWTGETPERVRAALA